MDVFNESFWLAISFFIFIFFAYRPIKKVILNTLDNKINLIRKQLQEAQDLRKSAEELLEKTEKQISNLNSLRNELLDKAKADADQYCFEHYQQIESILNYKKSDAINKINSLKQQAVDDLKKEIVDLSTKLATEYLQSEPDILPSDLELAKRLMKK